ncbi:MAG: hypothetical protein Ct9H90mP1_1870 [Methanobacteriota archaeon]|nr:MAG: hypothetical protein Ct9H90mP1_1870 [Euryarchaeota archaeon]
MEGTSTRWVSSATSRNRSHAGQQGKDALDSDLASAAKAFEDAISALGPVAVNEAASPFLVKSFFLSIGTTWPEGKDHALMVITLENTGENNIST